MKAGVGMAIIKGIDNGYGFTKDSDFNIFKSAYLSTEPLTLSNPYKLNVNGQNYWIGEGDSTVEIDKIDSMLNKICTLNCLALTEGNEFNLVVGLPISQYKIDKEKFRDIVMGYNNSEIKLNEQSAKTIKINNVFVYAQGLASLYSSNINHSVIIVDVGSRTVDVAYLEYNKGCFNIMQYNTYYCGCLPLYSKLTDAINTHYKLTLKSNQGEKLLREGLKIFGEQQNIDNIRVQVLKNHFEELLIDLKLNYPSQTIPFILTGGGSDILFNAFKSRFNDVTIMKNNQFSNALGYYEIGKAKFAEREVLQWQIPNQIRSK